MDVCLSNICRLSYALHFVRMVLTRVGTFGAFPWSVTDICFPTDTCMCTTHIVSLPNLTTTLFNSSLQRRTLFGVSKTVSKTEWSCEGMWAWKLSNITPEKVFFPSFGRQVKWLAYNSNWYAFPTIRQQSVLHALLTGFFVFFRGLCTLSREKNALF